MTKLAELQHEFMACLRQQDHALKNSVFGTEKVDIDTRLGIYTNAYSARLLETLQEYFPGLHTLLGDDAFAELADTYINRYPSQHFSLRYFGRQLTALLETYPGYAEHPVLAEMAGFEWAVWEAFDAGETTTATLEELQTIPPEQWGELSFNLHPSCQLLGLEWNVPTLWQAIQEEAEPMAPEQAEYPLSWLVWRQGLATYFRKLDVDEAWALYQIRDGATFAGLCEGVCEWIDAEHAPARVVGFLQAWLEDGVLQALQGG